MDFSTSAAFWTSYATSNLVAFILLFSSIWKPATARFLYTLLFLWAGYVNFNLATSDPVTYLSYADHAILPFYKSFIQGWFSKHIESIVLTIAVIQFIIALSMWVKPPLFRVGACAGIIFLLAVAPLGLASAIPATIIMATGLIILFIKSPIHSLLNGIKKELFTGQDRFSDDPEDK
jgi:hypothetical protein